MDVKSCIFHLTLKSLHRLVSVSLLMLSENVQIATVESCNTVAGYYQRLSVCPSVHLYVLMPVAFLYPRLSGGCAVMPLL